MKYALVKIQTEMNLITSQNLLSYLFILLSQLFTSSYQIFMSGGDILQMFNVKRLAKKDICSLVKTFHV